MEPQQEEQLFYGVGERPVTYASVELWTPRGGGWKAHLTVHDEMHRDPRRIMANAWEPVQVQSILGAMQRVMHHLTWVHDETVRWHLQRCLKEVTDHSDDVAERGITTKSR